MRQPPYTLVEVLLDLVYFMVGLGYMIGGGQTGRLWLFVFGAALTTVSAIPRDCWGRR